MLGGYVKLWRKGLCSAVWQDAELWKFWCYCLLKASFARRTVILGRRAAVLEPGQFIASLTAMSRDTGLSVKRIRNLLALTEELEMIAVDQIHNRTRVRVRNWERYQCEEERGPDRNDQEPANHDATPDQDFERFWAAYPRKTGKLAAQALWRRLCDLRPPLPALLGAVSRQKTSRAWREGYIPNPATWLEQGRWDDGDDPAPLDAIDHMRLAEEP